MNYVSLNQYFRQTYGCKGYKIAIKGGMTCPNRDGTLGVNGCIFCTGSGEFSQEGCSVTEQINLAIKKVAHKNKNGVYIAYFQDFSNTYAPIDYLKRIFCEAIEHPQIKVLSIATRPDCLSEEVLKLLEVLNQKKPVWVELGLQTIHPETTNFIRRGYSLEVYDQAVKKLHQIEVYVITHLIIGLPGETEKMIIDSVKHISKIGTDGVKFHLLHILKNTDLYSLFVKGEISTLSFPEYLGILGKCISILPKHVVVHRLTGDGDKKSLVAPLWSADKKHVLNKINKYFLSENIVQGGFWLDNKMELEYNDKKQKGI